MAITKTKLKQSVVDEISVPETRMKVAAEIGIIDQTLYQHLKRNKPGGSLTKQDWIAVFSKFTGKPVEDLTEVVTVN